MANLDDVKDAVQGAIPATRPRRGRALPVALLVAAAAAAAALASRLQPVRSAVRKGVSEARGRLASVTGRGTPVPTGPTGDAPGETAPSAAGAVEVAGEPSEVFEAPATDLAAADAAAVEPSSTGLGEDTGDISPAEPSSIPADSEEGRPSGV